MGSGTKREYPAEVRDELFQSLPGINGVWHKRKMAKKSKKNVFQSLPGINGVWHISRTASVALAIRGFNPFQGLMGSGTSGRALAFSPK